MTGQDDRQRTEAAIAAAVSRSQEISEALATAQAQVVNASSPGAEVTVSAAGGRVGSVELGRGADAMGHDELVEAMRSTIVAALRESEKVVADAARAATAGLE